MLRALICVVAVTSSTVVLAQPYSGAFATDGVFEVQPDSDQVVRNHLELVQTGTQISGRLVIATTSMDVRGTVAADGRATLVIGARSYPISRVRSGIQLVLDNGNHLFKRAPSLTPLPPAVLTAGQAATGARFASPWGWSFAAPAGWRTTSHQSGALVEGNGIAIYAELPSPSTDRTRDALARVLRDRGGEWQLMQGPAKAQLPGASVELLEVAGFDDHETELRARVVGVTTKLGTVAFTGVARIKDLELLRASVDAIARSAKIAAPPTSEATRLVTGEWWTFTPISRSIGSGGTEYTISLCANGSYLERVEASAFINGNANTPGTSNVSTTKVSGRWTAVGTAKAGTIRIVRDDNGNTVELAYRADGAKVVFGGGAGYVRKQLGRCN